MPLYPSMTAATRTSWKTLPIPHQREHFDLPLLFSDADGEQIKIGHVPEDMDDKWFIFFENGWLYFHRSWTGHCIYGIRLDGSPNGVRVIDAWVNCDPNEYKSPGLDTDINIIKQLISNRLLS